MSSRSYFLVNLLFVVVLSGSALHAAEILWDGEAGDYMYCTPNNWDGNTVPEVNILAWEAGEIGWGDLNDAFIDDVNLTSPVIIDGTCSPPPCAKIVVGGDSNVPGTGLEINGGLITPFELVIGYREDSVGKVVMNDGIFNMMDYSYLGVGDGGDGTLIMNGGEINCHLSDTAGGYWIDWAGGLMVPKSEKNSPEKKPSGHLQLNGGIIRCRWFQIKEGGTVDIAGGTLVVTMPDYWYWGWDQRETIGEHIDDGVLTAYGGDPRAEVIGVDDEETGYYVITGYQYSLGQAYNSSPRHCSRWVSPDVTELSWSPGDYADSHDLYFGTDEAAVENATPVSDEYMDNVDVTSYVMPVELLLGKTYYCRVDEVNGSDESIVKGLTWNFRVQRYINVEDFDSYGIYIDPIEDVWSDYSTNGTRAEIYLETADANFIIDGNSMMYRYRNIYSPYYSESTRIFSPSMDWTTGGAKALVLWFHGEPGNAAERLYLRVTDGGSPRAEATIVYEDSNDLIQEPADAWHEWNIDLSELSSAGVDLNDINGITIGIGDGVSPGGDGYVYFENIRLYPTRCRSELTRIYGDFDGDCVTNMQDLEILAADWLIQDYTIDSVAPDDSQLLAWYQLESDGTDSSTNGADASEVEGSPTYVAGVVGNAAEFDGIDDYLYTPDSNETLQATGDLTIALWLKPDATQLPWAGILAKCSEDREDNHWAMQFGSYDDPGILFYLANIYWYAGIDLSHITGVWHHLALVYDSSAQTLTLYLDGEQYNYRSWYNPPMTGLGHLYIGAGVRYGFEYSYAGMLDDIRIYEYALSQAEIGGAMGISQIYQPIDSAANICDPEPPNSRAVNFNDYALMADNWLGLSLWP